MSLVERPHSINTYCYSKVWFRCFDLNLGVGDIHTITAKAKSWLFADQLEKPEEYVLFRERKSGGLGMVNVKYKALSLLICNFMETAVNPKFQNNNTTILYKVGTFWETGTFLILELHPTIQRISSLTLGQ